MARIAAIELVPPAAVGYWGIAFSHDGSHVFYATKSAQEPAGRLYVVNVLGGMPRALLDGIDSTITLSPDGRKIRVLPRRLSRARLDARSSWRMPTAAIRACSRRVRGQQFFVPGFFAAPSWSPDGARIAAAIHDAGTGDAGLVTVDAASGKIEPFPQRFQDATFTAWLPDGSGILFVADQVDALREFPRKVWLQPYPRGEPHRVTPDLLEYRNISVRGDGSAFVAVGLDAVYSLWRLPLSGRDPQRIASERYDGLLGVAPLAGRPPRRQHGRARELAARDPRSHGREPADADAERGRTCGRRSRPIRRRSCSCRIVTGRQASGG